MSGCELLQARKTAILETNKIVRFEKVQFRSSEPARFQNGQDGSIGGRTPRPFSECSIAEFSPRTIAQMKGSFY